MSTIEIRYCENGCTRRHGDEQIPATTEAKSRLCGQCEDRLNTWLTKIPDTYALLPGFVEHGTTEPDPDKRSTKTINAAAPMRLDIIDLLDTRRGRKWQGTEPTDDRRGVLGSLQPHVDRLIEERPLTSALPAHVAGCCNLLQRHRLWLAEQDWIADLYEDIRILNRNLSNAVGDYRQKPVGHCPAVTDDSDECGGPIFASLTGAHCARCGGTWQADQLRLLGGAMTA